MPIHSTAPRLLLAALLGLGCAVPGAWAQEISGQSVFMAQGCAACHAVPAASVGGAPEETVTAPTLEDLDETYRPRALRRWLKRDMVSEGYTHLKKFDGSKEELDALVEWLLEQ